MQLALGVEGGDRCSFWYTHYYTFEYESIEKFNYDLMTACIQALDKKEYKFTFLNEEFNVLDFGWFDNIEKMKGYNFAEPRVQTLEDWFKSNKIG